MTDPSSPPAPASRRPLWLALGGCVVLLLCLVVAGVATGGFYYLQDRGTTTAEEPAVEYVLDASPRMAAESDEGGTRLAVAQGVLAEIVRPADPSLTAGLRVFGTGAQADGCQDTDLVVPLAPANQAQISNRVLEVQSGAAADAAVGEAMLAAIGDLAATEGPHTLVVITGGQDSCNAEAGRLIAEEAERAGIRLQTFVVGYKVPEEEAEAIRGLVEDAGNSTYLNALNADELRKILAAIQAFVDDPTAAFPTLALGTPEPVAVGPDPTAVPGATAAAGEPTDTTDPVDPAPTQAGQPDATAEPSGYAAQTACDHPYFPLRAGASWTYAFDGGTYTWSVTEVTGDLENATATMHFVMDEVSIDYHWNCSGEGVVSYDYGNIAVAGLGSEVSFEVTSSSGAWLLPADEMVPGATWSNTYEMHTSMDAGGQSVSITTSVNENFTAAGTESVTTGAGTFETLRVDGAGSYNTSMSIGPGSAFDSTNTIWFAYGVGMVRNQSTSAEATTEITLVSYNIP